MTDTHIVDGTADDITESEAADAGATLHGGNAGTAVAVAPRVTDAIIIAERPEEVVAKATEIANVLTGLIEKQGLAVNVGGRKKHVEVGGWQALGAMLGALGGQALHAETVWTRKITGPDGEPTRTKYTANVKRYYSKQQGGGLKSETTYDVDGFDWEASVQVCTAGGVVVGSAEAMCSRAEETWNTREDFAVRSMAETRAESRAYRRAVGWIVNIAGYSPTPAEEMGHTPGADTTPAPPEAASTELENTAANALAFILGVQPSHPAVKRTLDELADGGRLPKLSALAIGRVAVVFKRAQDARAEVATPDMGADQAPAARPVPDLPADPALATQALRASGCTCEDPLSLKGEFPTFNDACPLDGHGAPTDG